MLLMQLPCIGRWEAGDTAILDQSNVVQAMDGMEAVNESSIGTWVE